MAIHTATTPTACGCCVKCVTGGFFCRRRGGLAALCGESALDGTVFTPDRRWRNLAIGGSYLDCEYTNPSCSGSDPFGVGNSQYSGTKIYDQNTCVVTNTLLSEFGGGTHPGGCVAQPFTDIRPGVFAGPYSAPEVCTHTLTPTHESFLYDKGCVESTVEPDWTRVWTGSVTQDLTVEDTESDATTRVLAQNPWSAYGALGIGCVNPACCLAAWQVRTSGITFVYQEAQWRITQTGLIPGHIYKVPVQYWRRTYGIGSYTLFNSVMVSGTADGGGLLDVSGDIPIGRGFETYAQEGNCPP